jgi:endonuclease/exonuclease/phosphatase family metal-dependent hydrolase
MINIGFWNIKRSAKQKDSTYSKNDLSDLIVDFIREAELDILCLAECEENTLENTLLKINRLFAPNDAFSLIPHEKSQVRILSRLEEGIFSDKGTHYDSERWSAHHVRISDQVYFNLMVVHFPSKLHWSNESQAMECVNLAHDIRKVEDKTDCKKTVVIGDFNMDPFEPGMVSANGLHALSDLSILTKGQEGRKVNDIFYPFFYNPMWNHFGDHQPPAGTYYYSLATHISYRWHLFDQVLVRPALHENLRPNSTKIVTKVASTSLISDRGTPSKELEIDHLPIILKLYI